MNPWRSLIDPASSMPRQALPPACAFEDEDAEPEAPPKRRAGRPVKCAVGDVVGQWTLLEFIPGRKVPERVHSRFRARCSCGEVRLVRSDHLAGGQTSHCGHDLPGIMSDAMRRHHSTTRGA